MDQYFLLVNITNWNNIFGEAIELNNSNCSFLYRPLIIVACPESPRCLCNLFLRSKSNEVMQQISLM